MKSTSGSRCAQCPVNLTLNEDLVADAKSMTDNLSDVADSLLPEFVERERRERMVNTRAVEASIAAWNKFNVESGSIAEEYSSL